MLLAPFLCAQAAQSTNTALHHWLEISVTAVSNGASYSWIDKRGGQGEGGKTEEDWLVFITALPAAAYNSSGPAPSLPSLLTTHPGPYLPTAAPQSPPFSYPNHSPAVPFGYPSTFTDTNPISNLSAYPLTPVYWNKNTHRLNMFTVWPDVVQIQTGSTCKGTPFW